MALSHQYFYWGEGDRPPRPQDDATACFNSRLSEGVMVAYSKLLCWVVRTC